MEGIHLFPLISTMFLLTLDLYHLEMSAPNIVNVLNLSCSKLVIFVTEHLVEVVDKLSTTSVVFFRSEEDYRSS